MVEQSRKVGQTSSSLGKRCWTGAKIHKNENKTVRRGKKDVSETYFLISPVWIYQTFVEQI